MNLYRPTPVASSSLGSTDIQYSSNHSLWQRVLGFTVTATLAITLGLAAHPPLASADTITDALEGEWVDAPAQAESGFTVLTARWWFNLNDGSAAPRNRIVADNVLTLHTTNARFNAIPSACETTPPPGRWQ